MHSCSYPVYFHKAFHFDLSKENMDKEEKSGWSLHTQGNPVIHKRHPPENTTHLLTNHFNHQHNQQPHTKSNGGAQQQPLRSRKDQTIPLIHPINIILR